MESPRHDLDLASMSDRQIEAVVRTYRDRFVAAASARPRLYPLLFRNHGREAGTSLRHPHAQLVATTFRPPEVHRREARLLRYHRDRGRCLLCELPSVEPELEERLVTETAEFLGFVPWAPEAPLEVWIVPRRHLASFGTLGDAECRALARTLRDVLARYRRLGGDIPHNVLFHSSRRERSGTSGLHWFLQIRPRTRRMAGFEHASGVAICDTRPEEDAALLRDAGSHQGGHEP